MTDEVLSFAVLLGRYRAAMGLTQEELAERAGLSVRAISDLERAVKTRPRATTVRRLAEALQLSPDDRVLFERSARTAGAGHADDARPLGTFLDAPPTDELIGREEEQGRIRSLVATAAQGRGHLLLLGGEGGAGKTRLLQEVSLAARGQDSLVLVGHCSLADLHTPYAPFLAALGELAPGVSVNRRAECERAWKRVQRLIAGAAEGTPQGNAVRRQQILTEVGDLVLLAARAAPLAILLDDLHWADPDSLKLLPHLARLAGGAPLLLAASFCDVQLAEQHPDLAQTLQVVIRERLAERLTVRRLSLEETTELVAAAMGQAEVSEEFGSFVYRRTKGNPRLLDGLVRSLGGRLELQGEIGAGSMGRVFRALDRRTGKVVAAKLVLARSAIELDALLRWQQEGAVLARLNHPHIVAIYDTFAEEHATCIIMELLDGQPLGHILREGPLPLPRTKDLALQVVDALAYAHTQGIVHRDVKPDNVMVLPDDQVKVTDFGIARILTPDLPLQTIATTGMRMGTPLYMAPEQIEGKKVDGRTDIYALGAMLYHMVTGRPPFQGNDALAIAVKHLQELPLPPSQHDPAVPPEWDTIILKAMAKDPALRFQRAEEMEEAIAALPAKRGETTSSAEHRHRGMTSLTSRFAGLGAALAVVAVAAWLLMSPPWLTARAHEVSPDPSAVWGVKLPSSFNLTEPAILSAPVRNALYVADPIHMTIARLSAKTGMLLAAWGSLGTKPGQFRDINDLAVDRQGHVYAIDDTNDRITEFTADGRLVRTIGHKGFNPGEFYGPTALTIDSHGDILVTDAYNDRLQKLSPTGQPLAVWAARGHAPGQVYGPNAIRLDAHGNAWVSEHVNLRVQEFSPAGKSLAIIGKPGKRSGEFFDPQSIAFDPAGNLYVLEVRLDRIQKFSPTGKLLAVWDKRNHPDFKSIQNMSIDSAGHVYVLDPGNLSLDSQMNLHLHGQSTSRIHILTTGGKLLADWNIGGLTTDWNVGALLRQPFRHPAYAALDARGNAYVSDPGSNTIEEVSPTGALVAGWGGSGNGPGQLRDPSGVALDAAGHVYVADTLNGRIQEFSASGAYLGSWDTGAAGSPSRARPTGLAIDGRGNIYVTDPARNLVQEFAPSHKLRLQWGTTDSAHSLYSLLHPAGIAVDTQGHVYVVDAGHFRVVEYALNASYFATGRPLRSWGGTRGDGPGELLQPLGLAVDARGDVMNIDVENR